MKDSPSRDNDDTSIFIERLVCRRSRLTLLVTRFQEPRESILRHLFLVGFPYL